jgi:hypothetical protein
MLTAMVGFAMMVLAQPGGAHSPLLACYDEGEEQVTCEGGYSDGAPAAGQTIRVLTPARRLILEARFDRSNTYKFRKPVTAFLVEFEGDSSHLATFDGEDLIK